MSEKEKRVVDIGDFFTTSNERAGVWIEPKINGRETGFEVKVLGIHADEVMVAADQYDKASEKLETIKDSVEKVKKSTEAQVERVASCVSDIRGKDGAELVIDGKPVTYSKELVRKILSESPDLRAEILAASVRSENFMRKRN